MNVFATTLILLALLGLAAPQPQYGVRKRELDVSEIGIVIFFKLKVI